MTSLILVRHGQSDWNLQNRFTGWVDVKLSKQGIAEAKKSGELIKSLGINLDLHFTSYLKRAVKTLDIILSILNKNNNNVIKAWELNERHYGGLTGLNKDEMKKKLGEQQVKKFRRAWHVPPPPMEENDRNNSRNDPMYSKISKGKIPMTESLKDTYSRVIPYFESEIEKYIREHKNILVVAHGNSLRVICKKILKISNENISKLEIPTGNPLVINFKENLEIINYAYLDETRKTEIIFNK